MFFSSSQDKQEGQKQEDIELDQNVDKNGLASKDHLQYPISADANDDQLFKENDLETQEMQED